MFKAFICCLLLASQVLGALYRHKETKPDKLKDQQGCYVSKLDRVLKFGESGSVGSDDCQQYICPSDGNSEDYQITNCPVYSGGGCVLIPGNPGAAYPHCCDELDTANTKGECYGVA